MFLTKLTGRKNKKLKEMLDDPVIIVLKTGKIYAGLVEAVYYFNEYYLELYECKLLSKDKTSWSDHDFWTWQGDDFIRELQPAFAFSDIWDIFVLKEEYVDTYIYEDVLHFFIDPYYKPLKRIKCKWNTLVPHSKECDEQLHEALSNILTYIISNNNKDNKIIIQNFEYIRRRLIKLGANIP